MSEPNDPQIPDLKNRPVRRAPTGFTWSDDPVLHRTPAPAGPRPSLAERFAAFRASPAGRAVGVALPVLFGFGLGLAVLGYLVLELEPAKPGGRNALGPLGTTLRVRPDARNRLRYLVAKGGAFFGLAPAPKAPSAAGAAEDGAPPLDDAAAAVAAAAEEAISRALDGAGPDAPAAGSGGRTSAGASGASAAAPAAAGRGAAPAAGAAGADAAARFSEAGGRTGAKAARKGRVTRAALLTGGRKDSASPRGAPPVTGTALGTGGRAAPGEARPSGLDFVVKGEGASGGGAQASAPAGRPAGTEAGGGGAGGAGAGGGSGPGAGPGEGAPAVDTGAVLSQISSLIQKSSDENEKARKEKVKAEILAAGGQLPQAAYHYKRSEDAQKKADRYADQAKKLTAEAAKASSQGAGAQPAP